MRWRKPLPKIVLFVNTIAIPMQIGLYEKGTLVKSYIQEGKSSDTLPLLVSELQEQYDFEAFVYVNGPGSYMGIKVAYVFLQTLAKLLDIPLQACDGFALNGNRPIKAMGKRYFIKKSGEIETALFQDPINPCFELPKQLSSLPLTANIKPLYITPAV